MDDPHRPSAALVIKALKEPERYQGAWLYCTNIQTGVFIPKGEQDALLIWFPVRLCTMRKGYMCSMRSTHQLLVTNSLISLQTYKAQRNVILCAAGCLLY
ncbi:hypothetical protein ACFE04_000606 [Oxalis oulophora]